jgi:hypothetical protein
MSPRIVPRTGRITWDEDDHWPGIEIDQLRDDVEEAEGATVDAQESADKWCACYERKNDQYTNLKNKFDSKVTTVNHNLKNKCMILLDLIEQYELMTGGMLGLTTPFDKKIKQLRQQGGLDV